jgi:hypothetical protein
MWDSSREKIRARHAWDTNTRFWDERMADGNDFFTSLIWPSVEKLLRPGPEEKLFEQKRCSDTDDLAATALVDLLFDNCYGAGFSTGSPRRWAASRWRWS